MTNQLSTTTSDWTQVTLGIGKITEILRDLEEESSNSEVSFHLVEGHIGQWCRENIRGGFTVMAGGMTKAEGKPPRHAHLVMAFRRPDQAVKFKLTWS